MIKRHFYLPCFFAAGFTASPANAQSVPPSAAEIASLRRLEPQRATQALQYLTDVRTRHGLDERYTFKHVESITDPYGTYHGRFREYFNGVRVMGGNAIVHIDRTGQVGKPALKLFGNVPVTTQPAITQADAIARARAAFDPAGRMTGLETSDVELIIYVSQMPVAGPTHRRYDFAPRSSRWGGRYASIPIRGAPTI